MADADKWSPNARELPGLTRPLTPDECKEVADSFLDLPPKFRLTAEDLEILQEEIFGTKSMHYGSAQEAVKAMKRRLTVLKAYKARALDTLDDCSDHLRPGVLETIDLLNRQIADTHKRLESYEFQERNEN